MGNQESSFDNINNQTSSINKKLSPKHLFQQPLYSSNQQQYRSSNQQLPRQSNQQQYRPSNQQLHRSSNQQPPRLSNQQPLRSSNQQPPHLSNQQPLRSSNQQPSRLSNQQLQQKVCQQLNQEANDALLQSNNIIFVKDKSLDICNDMNNLNQLSKQYNFNDINIINVNDKINEFKEYQKTIRNNFENEYKKREDIFNNSLELFEKSNQDPYKILELDKNNCSIDQIKKAYKKLAIKHHPDKNGDEELFKKVTQAYCYLSSKYNEFNKNNIKINQEVKPQEYENNINENVENIYINKDNFNINKFNEIFQKFKISEEDNEGYGDLMDSSSRKDEQVYVKNIFNNKNFNIDIFNTTFNNQEIKNNDLIIEYTEPTPLYSGGFAAKELGKGKVEDFSGIVADLNYTDYKSAYSSNYINHNNIKNKTYKNLDDLKKERENISHTLSFEDKQKIKKIKELEDEKERQRLDRLRGNDILQENLHSKINKYFIKN